MLRIWMIPAAAALFVSGHAAVVYDNSLNRMNAWVQSQGPVEAADLLTLAGTERTLTGIEMYLGLWTPSTVSFDLAFRVYELDPTTNLPGAILAETAQSGFQHSGAPTFAHYMDMPQIQLTDDVVVGAKISNVSGEWDWLGFIFADPPVVGSSDPHWMYWFFQTGTGGNPPGWGHLTPSNNWGNLAIVVHAVPEPASIVAILAGLAVLGTRRRKTHA